MMYFDKKGGKLIGIALALLCLPVIARAESIAWAVADAPPFHIVEGEYAGEGFCDLLIDGLREKLPEFGHELVNMPQARVSKMIRSGEPMCFPCVIKKEEDPEFIYSDAINIRHPHRLILNEKSYHAIRDDYGERVSLAELLTVDHYRFGYPLGRKYGTLQPIIDQSGYRGYNKLSLPVEKSVFELVSLGRLDYTIDYEMVATYYRRAKGKKLYILEIEENHQQQISGAVGCTNSPWGERTVNAINRVLPDLLSESAYRQSLHFWFGDSLIYPRVNSQE